MQELLNTIKAKINQGSFWTKWFWYILLALASIVGLALLVLTFINKSNKIATITQERDVLQENAIQAKVNADILGKEESRKEHLDVAEKAVILANEAAKDVETVKQENKQNKDAIDSIENWGELDGKVKW